MECENCGSDVPEGAKFCPACGKQADDALTGEGQAAAVQGQEAPSAAQPPTAPGPPPGSAAAPAPPPAPPPAAPSVQGAQPQTTPPGYYPPPGMPAYAPQPGVHYVRNNPLCVASLIIGIAAIVFLWGPFLGIAIAAAGIICGVLGMQQVNARPQEFRGHGLGMAGVILSATGGFFSLVLTALLWTRVWWWR